MKKVPQMRRRLLAWGLGLGVACAVIPPVDAAEIRIGGIIPGAGLIHKRIVSMRERQFIDLVPQRTDFSCGAAALATILNYAYGQDTTEQEIIVALLKVSDEETVLRLGFSLLDMKNYVQARGMRGVGFRMELERLEEIKVPTIVLVDIKGYKHFVVLKKVKGDKIYVADPALGNKIMKIDDFAAGWNGIIFAVIGDDYNENTVLVRPPEPLSARRLLAQRAPVIDANVFDFGLTYADLF